MHFTHSGIIILIIKIQGTFGSYMNQPKYSKLLDLWFQHYSGLLIAQSLKDHLQCRRPGFDPWVRKIPLEEGMATHSSLLAWRIPWTKKPGGLQSTGSQEADMT